MSRTSLFAAAVLGASLFTTACALEKDDAKGIVDDSLPPSNPAEAGKADDPAHTVNLTVQSPHPYANNVDRTFHIDLVAALPACSQQARVHFSILRTEANYDYVDLEIDGDVVASYDGTHDNTYSPWFDVTSAGLDVHLTTDGSVTRHGFVIDRLEWAGGAPHCPPLVGCPAGEIGIVAPVASCTCPAQPVCVALGDVTITHTANRGFMHTGKRTEGVAASTLGTGPADGIEATAIGNVDAAQLEAVLTLAQANGVLFSIGYDTGVPAGELRDYFAITAGDWSVSFSAAQGGHTVEVANVIAAFEVLFQCAGDDAALTCGDGFSCVDFTCQADSSCACAEIYQPVCGVDGRTYGNACMAGCAEMPTAHDGECGQVGDQCHGRVFPDCVDDNQCRYDVSTFSPPFRDATGVCVARTYCDAPVDCNDLPAPAVLGSWACETNVCAFRAGPNWRAVTDGRLATAHPYANSTSVWKAITLPAEGQAIRLVTTGTFRLERNYDFLEVWSWQNGAWVQSRRYTGTTGPALTDTFTGRYFYLRFVSDASVVDQGFDVRAEWR